MIEVQLHDLALVRAHPLLQVVCKRADLFIHRLVDAHAVGGDGNDRDIGYCRSIQRPDGKVVTTYYINVKETGPERYIAATIWDPAGVK